MSEQLKKIYALYASVYDILFGKIFEHGRQAVFSLMDVKPGERILELGAGTGLSLPHYPSDVEVIAIDLSMQMLKKAKNKIIQQKKSNVQLFHMDASSLAFADNTFDKVVASHVITVVPDPLHTLKEVKRVCKNNGEIFILNYTGSNNCVIYKLERFISPLRNRLGLGKHLCLDELLESAQLQKVCRRNVNIFNMCQLIKCRNI